jgi:hypothetical protein
MRATKMTRSLRIAACLAFAAFSLPALAESHPYSEGPVLKISRIRTGYGHFEDYMKYLDGTWKAAEEEAKKAGYIVDYKVIMVEPHDADDPDILLVITYKNYAALDNWIARGDEIRGKVVGPSDVAEKAAVDRGAMRRVLGTYTMQVLDFGKKK